jgi:hypothetical protein
MNKAKSAVFALALGLTALPVGAATLSGTFGGTLAAPSGATSTLVTSGGGSNELLWGTATSGGGSTSGESNSLTVNGGGFSNEFLPNTSGNILLGTISWHNQSTFNSGGEWGSTASINVNFTSPSATSAPQTFSFSIAQTSDPDGNPGTNEGTGLNPDVITLSALIPGGPLDLGSGLTVVSYFFDMFDAGTAGSSTGSSSLVGNTWTNREGNISQLGIYASVQTVPLPAAAWLFGSALIGLVAVARRRVAV